MASPFGMMLDTFMQRGGWTQEELAAQSGVHHTFISKLVNGKRMPSRANALAISKGLGLDDEDRDRMLKAAGFSVQDAGQPDWLMAFIETLDDVRLHPTVRRQMISMVEVVTQMASKTMEGPQ